MRGLMMVGLAVLLGAPPAATRPPNAARLSKYILTVGNLERTYAFYHDGLGLALAGKATGLRQPVVGQAIEITGAPPQSSFRNANLTIPGADFTLEFIELTGLDRTARRPRLQDPGAAVLVLTVRDIDQAVAGLTRAGGRVVTLGGAPLALTAPTKRRAVFVSDPDGFYVELSQPEPLPAGAAAGGPLVVGARWATVVEDAARSARFYADHFGMEATVNEPTSDPMLLKLGGLAAGTLRTASVKVPGRPETWLFLEFRGVDRTPVHFRVGDPGSLQLGLQVHDVDAAAAAYKAAGGAIVSKGGALVRRQNGGAVGLMRDPDGVYLEVATVPPPA